MEWFSKCPASGQQRITDVCEIVCTALVSQLWRHNNKVAHFIQHKPPGRRPTLQNTLNQYFTNLRFSLLRLKLEWMWPLLPGCDWILTFQQVTKYHIL